ncbi:uncharacterized protein METZ01_LOCUS463007, partial [marine metagenome]
VTIHNIYFSYTADAAQGTVSRYPVYSGPFIDIPGNMGVLNMGPF